MHYLGMGPNAPAGLPAFFYMDGRGAEQMNLLIAGKCP